MDDARRCRAKSKQSQLRCGRAAIIGGFVCNFHGGKNPGVVRAAHARLLAQVDPAITALEHLILAEDVPAAVRFMAVRDVLDRCGLRTVEKIETSGHTTITVEYVGDWRLEGSPDMSRAEQARLSSGRASAVE
jgi:hypothetical protein